MATKIIKAWINGSAQDIEVEDVLYDLEQDFSPVATVTSVNLLASNWQGSSAPYSQVVTINGVTPNTKVDLTPTAAQTAELQDDDIAFIAENDYGIVTVWSINCKPEKDYDIQATLTEVTSV